SRQEGKLPFPGFQTELLLQQPSQVPYPEIGYRLFQEAVSCGDGPAGGVPAMLIPGARQVLFIPGQHKKDRSEEVERNGSARLVVKDDGGMLPPVISNRLLPGT